MKNTKCWVYGMMLLAGLMDATTGALLLAAPMWTLNLMGITALPLEPLFQRWIGAFVCSVGCSYLFPFLLPAGPVRDQRSIGILTMATIVRIFIAAFSGVAIATGALEPAWLSVTFTDATLAILQLIVLRKKILDPVHAG
jgi:hypothetical protein